MKVCLSLIDIFTEFLRVRGFCGLERNEDVIVARYNGKTYAFMVCDTGKSFLNRQVPPRTNWSALTADGGRVTRKYNVLFYTNRIFAIRRTVKRKNGYEFLWAYEIDKIGQMRFDRAAGTGTIVKKRLRDHMKLCCGKRLIPEIVWQGRIGTKLDDCAFRDKCNRYRMYNYFRECIENETVCENFTIGARDSVRYVLSELSAFKCKCFKHIDTDKVWKYKQKQQKNND